MGWWRGCDCGCGVGVVGDAFRRRSRGFARSSPEAIPATTEPEMSKPSETPLDVQKREAAPAAKVSDDQGELVQAGDHVSTLEALDASEVPAVDDLNTNRGLSVKDRAPRQEVRRAKVEVRSEH